MANSRMLKFSFFRNEELAEVSMAGRLLFQGLWLLADREGRLEDRVRRIRADIFPYDDVDVETELHSLVQHGFIQRYTVDGKRYIWVINFLKHQNIHAHEAASTLPPLPQCLDMSRHADTAPEHVEECSGYITFTSDITSTVDVDVDVEKRARVRTQGKVGNSANVVQQQALPKEIPKEKILAQLPKDLKAKFTPEEIDRQYGLAMLWLEETPGARMGAKSFARWLQREIDQGHWAPVNLSEIERLKHLREQNKPDEKGLYHDGTESYTGYRLRQKIEELETMGIIHQREERDRERRAAYESALHNGHQTGMVLPDTSSQETATRVQSDLP